ncbi:MAG TPA: histidine kinase dimerization/phospho-acceptor domain-containing protein, partial [Bacilli bacterium]|nr:histidine kinase dimerization/phospho-acceptor domain-containing protein [Bacilli bacterium]
MRNDIQLSPNSKYQAAWERSVHLGVDPLRMPDDPPVPAGELQVRIHASRLLLEAALPYVDHLYRTVESECIVAICDQDGVLLSTRGERLPNELLQQHTTPGMVWTEARFGANAMGTALAEDAPVHMVGDEHFLEALHGMSCAATPLHDDQGQIVGALAIAAYKTEHSPYMLGTVLSIGHAIEKAMILKSEHYQSLLLQEKVIESSNNLMFVTDASGRILHSNKAAQLVFGASTQERLQDLFPQKSAALIALQERRNLSDFQEKRRPCDAVNENDVTHISWDAHWIEDSLNEQSTLLLVGRDVTKHVRMERTIHQSERLSTMGKFSAQIAHEIRNPVAVIKLAMQLMLKQEEFSEKSQKKGAMILSELRRIEDLVNHFLQISKPQEPNFRTCRITELVQDTCQLMQGAFVDANLRLVERCEDVGPIHADCDQLQQVFLNLLR